MRWEAFAQEDKNIKKAVEILRAASQDPETRRLYEMRQKALKDYNSMKAGALEEGMQEGIKEGREIGIQEAKTDIAKRMIEKGLEVEQIVNFTGLTKEEIKELAEKYGFEGNF